MHHKNISFHFPIVGVHVLRLRGIVSPTRLVHAEFKTKQGVVVLTWSTLSGVVILCNTSTVHVM